MLLNPLLLKGRDDNIALAHEVYNNLYENMFVAKLDLEKVFDVLNRESLLHRMGVKGFSNKFLKWVKAALLTSISLLFLIARFVVISVLPMRSDMGATFSFLFTLAMNSFSYLMNQMVNLYNYASLYVGWFYVSHLLFMDDMLIVNHANLIYVFELKKVLDLLFQYIWLKINSNKFTFFTLVPLILLFPW